MYTFVKDTKVGEAMGNGAGSNLYWNSASQYVIYGNLGVPQRMQFTVIGTAANEARALGWDVQGPGAVGSCFLGIPILLSGADGLAGSPCYTWAELTTRSLHAD